MKRQKKMLILSIGSGLLCVTCVLVILLSVMGQANTAREEALSRYGGDQIEACVASRDILPGEAIDSNNVQSRMWLADLLPQDAVLSLNEIKGKAVSSAILKGEVVSLKRFDSDKNEIDVPEGLTALSVPAKDVQAVGGAIQTGSRVDVYSTGATSTNLIGSDILVLATSTSSYQNDSHESVKWITLALSSEKVQEVVIAAQKTELYFTLPHNNETNQLNNNADIVKGKAE